MFSLLKGYLFGSDSTEEQEREDRLKRLFATSRKPSCIIDDFLFLSDMSVAEAHDVLQAHQITFVLSVTPRKLSQPLPESYTHKIYKVMDSSAHKISEHFDDAHAFIEEARSKNCRVLVHCEAGISRSATIVISYMMKTQNLNLEQAYNFVKARRMIISPNYGFMSQLMVYERQLFPGSANNFVAVYMHKSMKMKDFSVEQMQEALETHNNNPQLALDFLYNIRVDTAGLDKSVDILKTEEVR